MIERWLIRRRDAAADRWVPLSASKSSAERRAYRSLRRWDTLLSVWGRP
ncbi:hypothetical protein IFU40_06205 [Microbacterium sp. CFBP 13617]|nr:hypothetical protein [Microbacterium sp. CFBP 13617]MBD8218225.1 hypothetical protein [Microbacterium sp. CFBP 13617]